MRQIFFFTKQETIQFVQTDKEAQMETSKKRKLEIFCTGTVTIFAQVPVPFLATDQLS